jgi:hypothetical protein
MYVSKTLKRWNSLFDVASVNSSIITPIDL